MQRQFIEECRESLDATAASEVGKGSYHACDGAQSKPRSHVKKRKRAEFSDPRHIGYIGWAGPLVEIAFNSR
jgi:hypothetical protein